MHWAAQYIGLPWSETGEGPESYHCWAFVRMVQAERFGRALPPIPNPGDLLPQARAFRDHPERARWPRVAAPEEGDCVLLRCARYPVHVGVWVGPAVGGGVLHLKGSEKNQGGEARKMWGDAGPGGTIRPPF